MLKINTLLLFLIMDTLIIHKLNNITPHLHLQGRSRGVSPGVVAVQTRFLGAGPIHHATPAPNHLPQPPVVDSPLHHVDRSLHMAPERGAFSHFAFPRFQHRLKCVRTNVKLQGGRINADCRTNKEEPQNFTRNEHKMCMQEKIKVKIEDKSALR